MKKLICIILLTSMLTLSACSRLFDLSSLADLKTSHAFDNDTWVLVRDLLVNKADRTIRRLKADKNAPLPEGVYGFYYGNFTAYNCEFEEASFNVYVILRPTQSDATHRYYGRYYDCMITYNYEGKEIGRSYIGYPLTRDDAEEAYKTRFRIDAFPFLVQDEHGLILSMHDNESAENQKILNFIIKQHDTSRETDRTVVVGLLKPIGDKTWFSTMYTKSYMTLSRDYALFSHIREPKITAYNPQTRQFETIYECDKNRTQIVDFDENGMYTYNSNREFCYVDFETDSSSLIYKFPKGVDYFDITDGYIFAEYVLNGYAYFVYEKGGSIIANTNPSH